MQEAANALRALLVLHLKLSYLSTKIPKALEEYTQSAVRASCVQAAHMPATGVCMVLSWPSTFYKSSNDFKTV